jgi:predicted O-methyltransferase YrrM
LTAGNLGDSRPDLVAQAESLAARMAFPNSCTPEFGRLLCTLAGASQGPVLEIGTGCGVGSAWLLSGLPAGGRLVSVEYDEDRHAAVSGLLGGESRLELLHGDWRQALSRGPFSLAFVDVGEAKDEGADEVVEAMTVGGVVALDDFTPGPLYRGAYDERWHRWMHHPRLASCEILISPGAAVILATKMA